MIFLGVDPDSTATAWATVRPGEVVAVGVLRRKRDSKIGMIEMLSMWTPPACTAAAVEGQAIHRSGNADPADIFKIAHISGAAASAIFRSSCRVVLIPQPEQWKGQVPKEVHHARILGRYGILYETGKGYCYPSGCAKFARISGAGALNMGDWKHVVDAIGLADYALRIAGNSVA